MSFFPLRRPAQALNYSHIISARDKFCNPFDKRGEIKYNSEATGTDSRVTAPKGAFMRKVRAPQGKNNG